MDPWPNFLGSFMPLPVNQQPQAYTYGNIPTLDHHAINEPALHNVTFAYPAEYQSLALYQLNPPEEPLVSVPQDTASLSDATPTLFPMGPPPKPPKPRKKKAPTLRAKDWEPYKARILELHLEQGRPLTKVRSMIKKEFGFTAELRQYRTRITQWGKDKNVKPKEMAAIVRKRQQRKLVEVGKREQTFTVRGRNVELHKIERWMVRNEVSWNSLYDPSPVASTPSAVGCRTISERGSVLSSPACSATNTNLSPRDTTSVVSSPIAPPPVSVLLWEAVQPHNNTFTGQSPAPVSQPLATRPLIAHSVDLNAVSDERLPRHYLQDGEDRIRGESFTAEDSLDINRSQEFEFAIDLGLEFESE